ncbi:alkaline phosphatase family protein [Chryseolinea sp. Jin1]|uniref:Alkaline phosphatase family protein n=2 Tax=Chryseolinea lacunae TaxID=2801331 RepID=A0ABS1L228_9BACT|nr:alkaline phosphatase family protein [Chryseolinea lacunae]
MATALSFAQKSKYVVMISIDGLRPEFYKDHSWPAPNIQALAQNGVYADGVRGVFPTVTYPSHTTMLTGAPPARHGIYYNMPFEPDGQTGNWYWDESLIKVETLWDACRKKGLKTASVHWPVSVGAPIDYNIPEVWPAKRDGSDRLAPMRKHTSPPSLFAEVEQNATGKLDHTKLNSDYLLMDENLGRITSYLIETYKPQFTTVHLVCVDHFAHADGRDSENVRKAVAGVDHAIGQIIESVERAGIKDSTSFLIVGDHGFVDIHTTLAPNVWLEKSGLIEKADNRGNWKAAFHSSGGSAFLHLKTKGDTKTLQQVQDILQKLPDNEKKLFRIITPEEMKKIGADPNVMLALSPIEGVTISASASGDAVRAGRGGTHGFYPDFKNIQTGFIGAGAGFQKGKVVPVMGLEDIAPIVSALLDLSFQAPDGIAAPGLLKVNDTK